MNLRQQLRRSRSAFASNFGALGQPSSAASALPVNLRQQLRRSLSTSQATSALPANLTSNFGGPGRPRHQLRSTVASTVHLPPRRHPQKCSCSAVTHGISNTSFSWCQCCFSAAQWSRDCTQLTTRPSPPIRTRSVRRCGSPALLVRNATPVETQAQRQVNCGALLGTKVALDTCEGEHVPHVLLHEACEHFVFQEKGALRRSLSRSSTQVSPIRSRKAPSGTKLSCNGERHIRHDTRPHDQPPAPSHWSEMN